VGYGICSIDSESERVENKKQDTGNHQWIVKRIKNTSEVGMAKKKTTGKRGHFWAVLFIGETSYKTKDPLRPVVPNYGKV